MCSCHKSIITSLRLSFHDNRIKLEARNPKLETIFNVKLNWRNKTSNAFGNAGISYALTFWLALLISEFINVVFVSGFDIRISKLYVNQLLRRTDCLKNRRQQFQPMNRWAGQRENFFLSWRQTFGGTMSSMSPPNWAASLMMDELVKIHRRPVMRKTVWTSRLSFRFIRAI